MAVYSSGTGTNIGELLRLIREEQAQAPAAQLPGSQVGSPMRGTVQEPLKSPEAPDSSRVVSLRPEMARGGVTPPAGSSFASPIMPAIGTVVRPSAYMPPTPTPVPTPPAPAGANMQVASAPSTPSGLSQAVSNVASKVGNAGKVLGTAVQNVGTRILPRFQNTQSTPKKSSVGPLIVPERKPTPTPGPSSTYDPKTKTYKKPGGGSYYHSTWGQA